MNYIEFFGFKDAPFRLTPDIAFFYSSPTHLEALDSLKYFATSDDGFMVLIGEPGTGKTITIRKFLNDVPENAEFAYILFPSLEPEDMFRAVLEDFGFKVDPKISKNTIFSRFRDFLTEKKKQGKKMFLVIDEAQNLPVRTLEELRILSNLETEKEKLIQFILAGQPELENKLSSVELRQMKQRVSLHVTLRNMNLDEMMKYVSYHLTVSGYQGQYPDKSFYTNLYSITEGVPRLVNLMMERALMASFIDQNTMPTLKHLETAAVSLRLKAPKRQWTVISAYAAAGLFMLLCAAGAIYYYKTIYAEGRFSLTHEPAKTETAPVKIEKPVKPVIKKSPVQKNIIKPAPDKQPSTQPAKPEQKTTSNNNPIQIIPVKHIPGVEPEGGDTENTTGGDKTAVGRAGSIIAGTLNIRQSPGLNSSIAATLKQGAKVTVSDVSGDWYKISFSVDNRVDSGWVFRKYIRLQ